MKKIIIALLTLSACGDDLRPEGAFEVHLYRDGIEVTCDALEPVRALVGPVRVPGQAYPILWPDAEILECADGPAVFVPTDVGDTVMVMVGEHLTDPNHQPLSLELEVEVRP